MAHAFVLLVVVGIGQAGSPSATSMTASLRGSLPKDAVVLVNEAEPLPDDAGAVAMATAVHADAVVEVSWSNPEHTSAHLHLRAGTGGFRDRDLAFDSSEPDDERGRALAFTIVAMLPAEQPAQPAPPPAAPPPRAPTSTTPIATSSTSPAKSPLAVETTASGVFGANGDSFGVGGGLGGRYAGPVLLRVGASLRWGRIPTADAGLVEWALGGGVGVPLTGGADDWQLSARADLSALHLSVSRLGAQGELERRERWITATDLLAEVSKALTPRIAFVASIGPRVSFGATELTVRDRPAGAVPWVSVVAEAGVTFRL